MPVNWTINTVYVMFQPCDCDPHGSFDNNCDPLTGQCACKLDYNGTQCDSCLFGFYGFPDCHLCLCSVEGTNPKSCDSDGACRCANADGQCNCKVSRSSLLPHSPHLTLCHLLITFANSLDLDQARHFVGPDLDPNRSTL